MDKCLELCAVDSESRNLIKVAALYDLVKVQLAMGYSPQLELTRSMLTHLARIFPVAKAVVVGIAAMLQNAATTRAAAESSPSSTNSSTQSPIDASTDTSYPSTPTLHNDTHSSSHDISTQSAIDAASHSPIGPSTYEHSTESPMPSSKEFSTESLIGLPQQSHDDVSTLLNTDLSTQLNTEPSVQLNTDLSTQMNTESPVQSNTSTSPNSSPQIPNSSPLIPYASPENILSVEELEHILQQDQVNWDTLLYLSENN